VQRGQGARGEELVGQRDGHDAAALPGEGEGGRDGFGQAAADGVVLEGDDLPIGAGRRQDGRGVERLDGGHVQDGRVDVVGGELLGGGQRAHGHQPGADEHDVAAGPQLSGLAEPEPVVVLVEDGRHVAAQQPQVGRPGVGGQRRHALLDVDRVARVDDGQVGHAAQDGDVLGGLVAGAVPGGQAG
jgi:hypothetical protein